MKHLRADVPFKSKYMSSLLDTYWSSYGNTATTFKYSSLSWFLVFLRRVQRRSMAWERMLESMRVWAFCSIWLEELLSADRSIGFYGISIWSLLSTFADEL